MFWGIMSLRRKWTALWFSRLMQVKKDLCWPWSWYLSNDLQFSGDSLQVSIDVLQLTILLIPIVLDQYLKLFLANFCCLQFLVILLKNSPLCPLYTDQITTWRSTSFWYKYLQGKKRRHIYVISARSNRSWRLFRTFILI